MEEKEPQKVKIEIEWPEGVTTMKGETGDTSWVLERKIKKKPKRYGFKSTDNGQAQG